MAPASGADEYFGLSGGFDAAVRGQSPGSGPVLMEPPSGPGMSNPFSQPVPQDPFLGPPPVFQPVCPSGPVQLWNKSISPEPYRNGWTPLFDMAYLPSSHTGPDFGNFSAFEYDSEFIHTMPLGPDLVFTAAPQFNYRRWDTSNLFMVDLYRAGVNLQLSTVPNYGPVGYQISFNPSINSDLQSELASESINLDASAVALFQFSPMWTGVLGVDFYDRVNNLIVPHVGVIYKPDNLWEFRLLIPQGRVSRYIGDFWWGSHWLYLAWEFHVDSFQVNTPGDRRNQMQYEDYRLTFGMRSDHRGFTKYIEAGYVFGRNVDFRSTLSDFNVSDGFIVRGGIRF